MRSYPRPQIDELSSYPSREPTKLGRARGAGTRMVLRHNTVRVLRRVRVERTLSCVLLIRTSPRMCTLATCATAKQDSKCWDEPHAPRGAWGSPIQPVCRRLSSSRMLCNAPIRLDMFDFKQPRDASHQCIRLASARACDNAEGVPLYEAMLRWIPCKSVFQGMLRIVIGNDCVSLAA
jgi:hypothetical protein